ncbi:SDR family NAD(P)-dependent oxidoreductase [Desulfitibacter alkalitolerans]|uniref:SDR family NAD(P)-dependent oxidoreductase n=1 Tax=Desulfitibacter alkalitolerans TaxID=264641 RepID=UPI00048A0339|nr:glucose 1-dehydrogenase [Desulfitibacter alkalitolerans]
MNDLFSVDGKVAVVTGGARGLGYTYAEALVSLGARVIICDIIQENIDIAIEKLSTYGIAEGYLVNVSSEAEVIAFVNRVLNKYKNVDILINNAGVVQRVAADKMDGDEWERVMSINVKGTFLCSRYFGEEMKKRKKGKIVNISSIAGRKGLDLRLAYCTSKSAIEHFTRTLAAEWGPDFVQVNAIAPGFIKTSMNEDLRNDPIRYKKMVEQVPLGRFGEPEELVGTLLYLVSSASDYVTGQTIFVDGGIITK